jgi:hypothetical protein
MSPAVASCLCLADLHLSLSASLWLYALIATVAVGLSVLIYRYTLPPVGSLRRTVLWVLRATALVMIVLMLFEPVLRYVIHQRKRPVVAVMVDESASMSVQDGQQSRADAVRRFLSSDALAQVGRRAQVRTFAFADTVTEVPADSLARLSPSGVGTDPAAAWDRVQKQLAAENLAAIVVVSDGAYNLGENPARVASHSPVPIFALGVGDTAGHADAAVTEVLTNDVVYAGSKVPLDVRVRGVGLAGRSGGLRLIGTGGIELGRETIRFDDDDSEAAAHFTFEAKEPGDLRLTVVLDSIPGEFMTTNNRRSVVVHVLEKRLQVFLFGGAPSADYTVFRQSLESDTAIEVTALVEARNGGFLSGAAEPSPEDMANARLIVLLDFPTRSTSPSLLERIARVTVERRIPVLFMAGPRLAPGRLSSLGEVVRVSSPRQALSEESMVTRAGAAHPALTGRTPLSVEWTDLPPVYGDVGNFTVQTGGQVVMKLSREELGVTEDEPGLVLWEMGARRGAAVLCWGTARWKLQLADRAGGAAFYDDLWSRIRSWLVAPVEDQRVKIRTTQKLYSGAQRVRFVGQVYGADLSPRDDAVVELRVMCGSRSELVPMAGRGNGRYEGELDPWMEGEYRYVGSAVAGGDTLGTDRGLFVVEAFNIELVDTRARFDILRQMAQASKGGFAPVASADTLLARLPLEPRVVTVRREIPLWTRMLMVWLIIGLLAAEWMIRKRSGML